MGSSPRKYLYYLIVRYFVPVIFENGIKLCKLVYKVYKEQL